MGRVRELIRRAKKERKNRAYYEKCFVSSDIRKSGIVQTPDKTQLERVQLAPGLNELIYLFAFDQSNGSHFTLKLSIVSLAGESRWRLAKLEFRMQLLGALYSYEHEQLIDYEEKLRHQEKHEHANVYKVGAMSIEQVAPFAFARILFTGEMTISDKENEKQVKLPMRLAISTHPTCDKFDYKYRFNSSYTANIINKSFEFKSKGVHTEAELLDAVLEDRFDQPLMFQGQLESLADDKQINELFIMWGAKVKKFCSTEHKLEGLDDERDCLFVWTECGQQIHLSRPREAPNLCYGFVHNSFDYPSHLYDCKLYRSQAGREEHEIDFSELETFGDLTNAHKITLRAFKEKSYSLEFERNNLEEPISPIKLNGFHGWALRFSLNLGECIRAGQIKLLTLDIHDQSIGARLANEQLCGGKGNSLVVLAALAHHTRQLARVPISARATGAVQVQVSVPRAVVVTTEAYKLWLASSPEITQAIAQLDLKRRVLAAKSVHLNPMSSKHVNQMEVQRQLRAACESTCNLLKSFPMPHSIKRQLNDQLVQVFGSFDVREEEQVGVAQTKQFAIRSSAVGEDALETSAAGQMRTILGARGFKSICESIVECWSSQFELEALTYKSQNGLEFNLPMGVVVQELIQCQVAGVAATCEPLTGNPHRLEITANLGLGEGVVGGKQTDTVRVSLPDRKCEYITSVGESGVIEKVTSGECCLSDEQIIGLANLLLELRRSSGPVSEREVEWGITGTNAGSTSSSTSSASSSSSSSDTFDGPQFQIHLFQSRPLTNLTRLSNREIDHELDWGLPSPLDLVTRANLGEVMPGALCPMNASWLMPVFGSRATKKPYEKNQTRIVHVGDAFAFHAQMAMMVLTYADTLKRFSGSDGSEEDLKEMKMMVYSMIGSTSVEPRDDDERRKLELFKSEKMNPLSLENRHTLAYLLACDSGGHALLKMKVSRQINRLDLTRQLVPLDQLSEGSTGSGLEKLREQINKIYSRLCTQTDVLTSSWRCHIEATILSMALNVTCLKLLSSQLAHRKSSQDSEGKPEDDNMLATQVLNDFSVLMREPSSSKSSTESGDISKLLAEMLESFVDDNLLDRVKSMTPEQLYKCLESDDPSVRTSKSARLFRAFMERNGHRAYREFCFSTPTWSDDSSYIVRMLVMRLKSYTHEEAQVEREKRAASDRERAEQVHEVEQKLAGGALKFALLKYALPRARNATIRREESKSLLIKTIHKIRLGFRHLGGLLCLAGLLPSASLIYYLTIEEVQEIISALEVGSENQLMARLLYKARRRQQRARVYDKVNFPVPTLRFNDMIDTIREQTGLKSVATISNGSNNNNNNNNSQVAHQVTGLVSCAGLVTGRACVIHSLDEVDQIQQGDILITYSIDISWSVYFFALAGIVTEVGGIVSHGAVVAREYGIPTLCTALGACSKFSTGQLVTLDANRGICQLASPEVDAN